MTSQRAFLDSGMSLLKGDKVEELVSLSKEENINEVEAEIKIE